MSGVINNSASMGHSCLLRNQFHAGKSPLTPASHLKSLLGLSRCVYRSLFHLRQTAAAVICLLPGQRDTCPFFFSVEMQIELLIRTENRLPPATPSPSVTCETRGELQQTCWQEIRKGRSRLDRSVRVVCANTHPLSSGAQPASC